MIIQFPAPNSRDDEGRVLLYCTAVPEVHLRSTDEFLDLEVTAFFSQMADGSITIGDHQLSLGQAIQLIRSIESAICYATPEVKPDGSLRYTVADGVN